MTIQAIATFEDDDKEKLLADLRANEEIIREGQDTFVNVGMALLDIKNNQQYLADGWRSFEDYCKGVWPNLPPSTRYYQLNIASVRSVLGPEVVASHAAELNKYIKDDPETLQKAWAEINLASEEPDTNLVSRIAKKHWVIKNSGPLGEAVKEQRVTPDKAYELQKTLQKLPDAYSVAVINYGLEEETVSPDTLRSLQALSYQDKDAVSDILVSGQLEDVPLSQLTAQDVQRYQRRLLFEKSKGRVLEAIDKQKAETDGSDVRIFDSVGAWPIEDEPLLYFIFSNGSIPTDEITKFVKNKGLDIFFVAVYDPENPPTINFDGKGVKPRDISVKPSNLMRYIKNSTLKHNKV